MWKYGEWGTVCKNPDVHNNNIENVVCNSLGFPGGYNKKRPDDTIWPNNPIWLHNVECRGEEASIFDCTHDTVNLFDLGHHFGRCPHMLDLFVYCNGSIWDN